jgi:hypothetical protein
MKPLVYIFNAETQEGIEREMTDVEYEQYLKDIARAEAERPARAE